MVYCKTVVSLVHEQWRYHSLALSQRYASLDIRELIQLLGGLSTRNSDFWWWCWKTLVYCSDVVYQILARSGVREYEKMAFWKSVKLVSLTDDKNVQYSLKSGYVGHNLFPCHLEQFQTKFSIIIFYMFDNNKFRKVCTIWDVIVAQYTLRNRLHFQSWINPVKTVFHISITG